MEEDRDFALVAELEVAGCVRGASEPARDVAVVTHLLAARSIVEFLVADVALLRIFELINIAGVISIRSSRLRNSISSGSISSRESSNSLAGLSEWKTFTLSNFCVSGMIQRKTTFYAKLVARCS